MKDYLILISFLFVTCCQNVGDKTNIPKDTIKKFDLKTFPKVQTLKLSDLGFTNVEYIKMETNKQSLITGTNDVITGNKIITDNNSLLIKHWNTILKFKSNGSFITSIGTRGRGPNEFTVAYDIDVNEKDQNIYLLSAGQRKFNVYSGSGKFIRAFQIPFTSTEFKITNEGILCYSVNFMANVVNSYNLIDTSGKVLKSFINKYPFNKVKNDAFNFAHENLFYKFKGKVCKKEIYSDTIYVFEDMEFKPHLIIEVGEKLITPKIRSESDGVSISKDFIDPLNLFEFGNYVYYEFIYKFVPPDDVLIYSFIGSKTDDFQALIDTGQGIINDLDGGPNILPKTIKDKNTIVAWLEPLKLKNHIKSEIFKNSKPKYPEKKKELEELANSLEETDNPVLVLVELKD